MDYKFKVGDVFEVVWIDDAYDVFEVGDLVVSIENTDSAPYCVKYEDYVSDEYYDYDYSIVWSMSSDQLKRL